MVDGHTTYFIQENSYDITSEYAHAIDWYIHGQLQTENPFGDNRLHLNCETHPEEIDIKATFLTNCGELLEITETFQKPNNCEEEEEIPPEPPENPSYANYCEEYKASLGPIGTPTRDHFEAYSAENRGFMAIEKTFQEHINQTLGNYELTLRHLPNSLPGQIFNDAAKEYMALSFILPKKNEANSGEFMITTLPAIHTTTEHSIAMHISPCPGDFRPRDSASSDPFLTTFCRADYSMATSIGGNTNHNAPNIRFRCKLPADKKLYINVSLWEMDNLSKTSSPDRVRELDVLEHVEYCSQHYCGSGIANISNQ